VSWRFAIERVQSVAAAGEPWVRPWVRRGGLPGRRSHTSKTQWALGIISTVRIGAGAWHKLANTKESGDTEHAGIHPHITSYGIRLRCATARQVQEQKGKREEAFKLENRGTNPGKKSIHPLDENLIAIARDSASLRGAPRGQLLQKGGT